MDVDLDLADYFVEESPSRHRSPVRPAVTLPLVKGEPTMPSSYLEAGFMFQQEQNRELELIADETHNVVNETCTVDLEALRFRNLRDLMDREPYNTEILRALFCSIQHAFIREDSRTAQGNVNTINSSISGLRIISHGRFGEVYLVTFRGSTESDSIFTIKIPIDLSDDTKVGNIHEFFVGLQLNKLECPNFMYVFSIFKCFAEFGQVFNRLCLESRNGVEKYYLMTEFIKGQDLNRWLKSMEINDLMSVYYQIILALHVAWVEVDFTHYDLHTSNVMLRDLGKVTLIPYTSRNGQKFFVKSRFLVKIIDYGFSHVKARIPGNGVENFGYVPGLLKGPRGIRPLDSQPIFDLLRITGSIVHVLLHSGNFDTLNKFFPMLYRFPSVRSKMNELPKIEPIFIAKPIDDMDWDGWGYSKDNAPLETDRIYLDTIDFGLANIKTTQLLVVNQPMVGEKVYSCANGCADLENIKQMLTVQTKVKKVRV